MNGHHLILSHFNIPSVCSPNHGRQCRLESLVCSKKDKSTDGYPHDTRLNTTEKNSNFPVWIFCRGSLHHIEGTLV